MRMLFCVAYFMSTPVLAAMSAARLQSDFASYNPDAVMGWIFVLMVACPIFLYATGRLLIGLGHLIVSQLDQRRGNPNVPAPMTRQRARASRRRQSSLKPRRTVQSN